MKGITLYYRDLNGRNSTISADSDARPIIYDFCKEMSMQENNNECEIQMLVIDGVCMYNSLVNDPVTWEDLVGYFA